MQTKVRTLHQIPKFITQRDLYHPGEMITLVLGFMMIILSLSGIVNTSFIDLRLSSMHALTLGASGLLAVWSALSRYKFRYRTFKINITLGIFFITHVIVWLLLEGAILNRTVVNKSLIRDIAPGFLELTPVENALHLIIGIWFLLDAYYWKLYINKPVNS